MKLYILLVCLLVAVTQAHPRHRHTGPPPTGSDRGSGDREGHTHPPLTEDVERRQGPNGTSPTGPPPTGTPTTRPPRPSTTDFMRRQGPNGTPSTGPPPTGTPTTRPPRPSTTAPSFVRRQEHNGPPPQGRHPHPPTPEDIKKFLEDHSAMIADCKVDNSSHPVCEHYFMGKQYCARNDSIQEACDLLGHLEKGDIAAAEQLLKETCSGCRPPHPPHYTTTTAPDTKRQAADEPTECMYCSGFMHAVMCHKDPNACHHEGHRPTTVAPGGQ